MRKIIKENYIAQKAKVVGLILGTVFMLTACVPQATTESETLNQGTKSPDFSLVDLEGTTHQLSDYVGQKIYIKFWASWCPICLAGLEDVQTLAAQADGYKVLTIVTPNANGEKKSDDFAIWFKGVETNQFTVLLDEDGKVAKAFGVRGFPTSAYIGTDGILVATIPGHQDTQAIMDQIALVK